MEKHWKIPLCCSGLATVLVAKWMRLKVCVGGGGGVWCF